jgi:hypothetical protein
VECLARHRTWAREATARGVIRVWQSEMKQESPAVGGTVVPPQAPPGSPRLAYPGPPGARVAPVVGRAVRGAPVGRAVRGGRGVVRGRFRRSRRRIWFTR